MSTQAAQLLTEVERIARDVAAQHADDVDRNARFPGEAVNALKEAGVLSSAVSTSLGGPGLNIVELGRQCEALARHCSATAMVLAMHHIQVASIQGHLAGSAKLEDYLGRLHQEQRLIASVTSELGLGGLLRQSQAPVERSGDRYNLEKKATTVSYGQHADDLLITARRDEHAAPGDQVLVLAERGEFELIEPGTWDSLGMRGTCSPGSTVRARGPAWQVMTTPFSEIAAETMVPYSHILWAAVWIGIAADAAQRARRLVQKKARASLGNTPSGARTLSAVTSKLSLLRHEWEATAGRYAQLYKQAGSGREELSSVAFALGINNLKLSASQLAIEIVTGALTVTGIAGYLNNTPYSVARHLRDIHSSTLMIHNQRIEDTNASLLLVHKGEG